jgi:hypothetical protein
MSRTERISQGTYRSLKMANAEPTQVVGRTVIITFHNRQWYEMLDDNPKVQAFIKKLLAHVLHGKGIGVRLELDPTMAVPPRRTRVAESRDNKKRYDRIAAITAQDPPPALYAGNAYPGTVRVQRRAGGRRGDTCTGGDGPVCVR